jgi:2-oxoglutarate dehydrogenase E2 component (dihydrolipoamide succinyltransferase)
MLHVTRSNDHRIRYGRESVNFLVVVQEVLENPVELLCGRNPKKSFEL